jgi:transcriptional regulator GlxA family with amidase domain
VESGANPIGTGDHHMAKHHVFASDKAYICEPRVKSPGQCLKVAILLTEGFSLLSLTSLTDVFSAVNIISPEDSVNVTLMSNDGQTIRSRSGVDIAPDGSISYEPLDSLSRQKYDFYVICTGVEMTDVENSVVMRLVRKCRRAGISICTIGAAIRLIAMSGYIQKGTDHWSRIPVIREAMPHIDFENAIFVRDGNFFSCSGELGAMDFALNWVGEHISSDTASKICNYLLLQSSRSADRIQTCTVADRFKGIPIKLQNIIELMLANIEEPIPMSKISRIFGISTRQIERMFSCHLSTSPGKFYEREKLELGMKLIEQTNMPIVEVAFACGFNSPTTFNKRFKVGFGITPTIARNSFHIN